MGQQRGFKSNLLIVPEASFGVSPGNGTPVPIVSHTLKAKANLVTPETITGRRDPSSPLDGYKAVEGQVVVPLELGSLAYWLTAMFGQTVTPWKLQDTVPSFQLVDNLPDISKAVFYNGCKVKKVSFAFGGDAELKMTLDIVGAKETVQASIGAPGAVAALERITQGNLVLTEGGVQTGVVTQMTLDIDFGVEDFAYPIGGGAIAATVLDGMVKIGGNVTALLTNDDLWAKARAATETSFEVSAVVGTKTLTIGLDEVRLDQPTKDLAGPKGRLIQFPFSAYFDDADPDNTAVQIGIAVGE